MIDFFVILGAVFSLISLVILSVGMTDAGNSDKKEPKILDRLNTLFRGVVDSYKALIDSKIEDPKIDADSSLAGAVSAIAPDPIPDGQGGGGSTKNAEETKNNNDKGNGGGHTRPTGPGPTRTPTTPTTTPFAGGGGDSNAFMNYLMVMDAQSRAVERERHHQEKESITKERLLQAQQAKFYERLLGERDTNSSGGGANFDERYVLKEEADEKYLTEEKLEGILRDNYGLGEKTIDYLTDLVEKAPNKVKEILKEEYNLDENTVEKVYKAIAQQGKRTTKLKEIAFDKIGDLSGLVADNKNKIDFVQGDLNVFRTYVNKNLNELTGKIAKLKDSDTALYNELMDSINSLETEQDEKLRILENKTDFTQGDLNVFRTYVNKNLNELTGKIAKLKDSDTALYNELMDSINSLETETGLMHDDIEVLRSDVNNHYDSFLTHTKKMGGYVSAFKQGIDKLKSGNENTKQIIDEIQSSVNKYGEQLLNYGDSIVKLQGQIKDRPTRRAVKKYVNEQLNGMIGQYTELKDRLEGLEKSGLIDNKTYIEITQKLEIYGKAIEELKKGGGNTFNQIINTTGEVINYQGPGGRVAQIKVTDPGSNKTLNIFGGGAPKYLQKGSNEK